MGQGMRKGIAIPCWIILVIMGRAERWCINIFELEPDTFRTPDHAQMRHQRQIKVWELLHRKISISWRSLRIHCTYQNIQRPSHVYLKPKVTLQCIFIRFSECWWVKYRKLTTNQLRTRQLFFDFFCPKRNHKALIQNTRGQNRNFRYSYTFGMLL